MPNLVKFREDPDAMLVMALEDYDEVTGKAAKAPIMLRDVVGQTPPVTPSPPPRKGCWCRSTARAASTWPISPGSTASPRTPIIAELGDLIYRDPEVEALADRRRLPVRQRAGEARRRRGRRARLTPATPRRCAACSPRTCCPATSTPASAPRGYRQPTSRRSPPSCSASTPSAIPIGHLKKDAVWSVEAGHAAEASVAATAEYGTPRANGTWLLELALNLKTPVIYDTVNHGDREERVVNQEATLAAREKQKLIKERFKSWVFAEPERTERLVRLYNDTYNNLRPRLFDGCHLDFPGMSQGIRLNPHQEDAVWRGMSSGNTLLAHAVGAGKTFTMAATGMKMKQAGLVKKPMYVVPNHMLEQFAREFMQLYPNARLLVATKDDLAQDRRKLLTAKIASGEWDGIIVTHSSFERIGMSKDYQERFLREQIEEYDQLLARCRRRHVARHRNIIKTIEKQKARREERLKDLLAEDKKDDGLVFDELGVDHVFIDEAHFFKNLETPTKMDRVAGIQTGGSERAFDLYMKARYLGEKHPGHGVTFATGTPISNTMVELYTMQRFLDPEGLKSRGIEHFDGWAATFGEVVDTMEISPDGASLRPRSRFARFVNLPELQQMFRAFADVQTAEMLDLPRPEAGRRQAASSSPARCRTSRPGSSRSWSPATSGCGRRKSIPARTTPWPSPPTAASWPSTPGCCRPRPEDFPGSKINALADNVAAIWRKTAATRGTQMIFCDMGVNPTPWGYCVYDEVIDKLIAPRHPRASRSPPSATPIPTPRSNRCSTGCAAARVRVLIGSTAEDGHRHQRPEAAGRPASSRRPVETGRSRAAGRPHPAAGQRQRGSGDLPLRHRRIVRRLYVAGPGNQGSIHRPGDDRRQSAARRAEDIGGQELSYAEVKAIASGNPAVLTLAEADAELQRLAILKKNHADEQYLARRSIRELPETIARLTRRVERPDGRHGRRSPPMHATRSPSATVLTPSDDALTALARQLERHPGQGPRNPPLPAGRVSRPGFRTRAACRSAPPMCIWKEPPTRHGQLVPRRTARVPCSTPSTAWPTATTAQCRHRAAGPGDRRGPAPRLPGPPGPALRPRRLPGRADGLTRPAQGRPVAGDAACDQRGPGSARRPSPNWPSGSSP